MSVRRFSLFQRRMVRNLSAWPMLASLLLVVAVAIGCVLWFMREAMSNERLVVREKLAEAYRGHLALVKTQASERWNQQLARLDGPDQGAARFARCVRAGLADSVICLDEQGGIAYPRLLAQRNAAVNAELLALESSTNKLAEMATRLCDRVNDYATDALPSAQRRFVMHELQRLDPKMKLPTLAAEELAARYLESNPVLPSNTTVRATELRGVWSAASPGREALALFTTAGLRAKLDEAIRDPSFPKGVSVRVVAPDEGAQTDSALVTAAFGSELPGWRLALSLDDRTLFDTEADRRTARYLAIGSLVVAALAIMAFITARGFGRMVSLARLKNDLVANVSHELKTPLTAMRALVETLLDAEKLDEKTTREYLQLLATENARLSRLIENFLTFSRLERNKFKFNFERIPPLEVVVSALGALGERFNTPGCTFESHAAADLPPIRGDADALVTALLNLLDNAWKYSGERKHIVLQARARDGHVCFSVEDNGVGLTPRECRRVFDRFYRADRRLFTMTSGCGLGLSIVQSIVEAHHGSVLVQSEPGRGSTFTIEIPVAREGEA